MYQLFMKKGFVFSIVVFLIVTSFGFVTDAHMEENTVELVDQSNGGAGCGGCEGASSMLLTEGFYIAQGFTPSQSSLSKIVLLLSKDGTPPVGMKLNLFIRETLNGDDLVSMNKEIDSIEMIFDFQDIYVVPENMYYMIITTDVVGSSNNGYSWYSTPDDEYSRGSCWTSLNANNWNENELGDMFFITYWKDYGPGLPMVEGPYEGVAQERIDYTFSATDPEGDDVYLYIEWGDGRTTRWIGPYESEELVIRDHQWAESGNFSIRVKSRDVYGVESDWKEFAISMPKQKQFLSSFLTFLENHPYLFPILQQLLKLQ